MTLKILLVDDEPKVLRGLELVINRAGEDWQVVGQCKNGVEALQLIRQEPPDVVITDIKMPGMDGLELVAQAKQAAPELQFIILSGYPDFKYAQQALKLGTVDYILKPPDYNDLLASLKKQEARKLNDAVQKRAAAELVLLARRERLAQYLDSLHCGDYDQALAILDEMMQPISLTAGDDSGQWQDFGSEFGAALTKHLTETGAVVLLKELEWLLDSIGGERDAADLKKQFAAYTRSVTAYYQTLNNPGRRKIINQIMVYIQNNYFNDISLRQIAAEVDMNESYLSDLFKRETGVTFMGYLTRFRVEQAKELLQQPDLKTPAVAEMVGYQNSKYFNKVFKKYTGMTPFEYREKG